MPDRVLPSAWMSIEVDAEFAPAILIFRLRDRWPTIREERRTRAKLIAKRQLTERTRALVDVRDITPPNYKEATLIVAAERRDGDLPRHRAYLVNSTVQFGFIRQLQSMSSAGDSFEIFTSEQDGLMWLHRGASVSQWLEAV